MRHVTREEMAEIDRRAIEERGIPVETLMENAGRAVARFVLDEYRPRVVTIVCGKGNNGGDGRVAARLLTEAGVDADVREPSGAPHAGANVIVDAIFGTGLAREVAGVYRAEVEAINRSGVPVVAVDIPSGLDANTGLPLGVAVRAEATVTMGLPKIGFRGPFAREYTGRIFVAEIGFPADLLA